MNPTPYWPHKYLTERRIDIDPRRRFVAEGDSWFSLGALRAPKRPNLLTALEFDRQALVVSCADPGDTLSAMAQRIKQDPYFPRLVGDARHGDWWAGILVSGGGNDLIDMLQKGPLDKQGRPLDRKHRLLLTPQEAGTGLEVARFVSEPGWQEFAAGLRTSFLNLDRLRHGGLSRSSPMLAHTYAVPVARPAGVPGAREGWLHPALQAYGIPDAERQALTKLLFERLRALLLSFDADRGTAETRIVQLHVFDSAGVQDLDAADARSRGESGDWRNEIHLTSEGYAKIGRQMGPWIEGLLRRYG